MAGIYKTNKNDNELRTEIDNLKKQLKFMQRVNQQNQMLKLNQLEQQIDKMMYQMQFMEKIDKKKEVRVKKKKQINKQKLIKHIYKKLENKFGSQKPPWRPVMQNDKIPRYEEIRFGSNNQSSKRCSQKMKMSTISPRMPISCRTMKQVSQNSTMSRPTPVVISSRNQARKNINFSLAKQEETIEETEPSRLKPTFNQGVKIKTVNFEESDS